MRRGRALGGTLASAHGRHPFFLRELIAAAARAGRAPELPVCVRAATSERLELLPAPAKRVFEGLQPPPRV